MNHARAFFILFAGFSALIADIASAAVIVKAENKTVIGSIDQPTVAFVEVYVNNDDPFLMLTAFQLRVEIDTPLMFFTPGNTEDRVQLLQADPFILQSTSSTVLAAKLGSAAEPLADNGGLARLTINIPENTFGVFPIRVISLAQDPDFGTAITGEEQDPLPLEITTVNGSINVVPEPAALGVLVSASLLLIRRRH